MRKNDPRYRKFIKRRANKKAHHEQKRRIHRKNQRQIDYPTRQRARKYEQFIKDPQSAKHNTYIAPESFSLIEDPVSVINYIESAHQSLSRGIPVEFDLSKIKHITPESLMLLCAIFSDKEFTSNTPIAGNIPTDPALRKLFVNVGFYKFVKPRISPPVRVKDLYGEIINRISRTKVEPKIASDIAKAALKYSLDISDIRLIMKHPIYPILIECMANTKEHSNYGIKQITYDWWVFAYKEPETKITKICFLDLGVGIFGSLRRKLIDNKLANDLINAVFPEDNVRTIKKIFEGEIKRTSTEKLERGLGLNDIYTKARSGANICNFTLISNDVLAHIDINGDKITKLAKSFMGTLYYFEIIPK